MDHSIRARSAACSIAAISSAMALAMALPAAADNFEYRASVGAGYTDNIRRDPINEQDENLAVAGLLFSYDQNTRRIHADVIGDIKYEDYLNNTYDAEVLGNVYADASFSLIPERLVWVLSDGFGQVLHDPFQPPNPANRQNINYLTTGPEFFVGLGSQMRLRVAGRYSLANYEDDPIDSNTTSGEVGVLRALSDRSSVSLNARVANTKYDNEALNADFDQRSAFLRYEVRGARTNIAADVGYEVLERDASDDEDSGAHVKIDVSRRFSQSSVVTLSGTHRFATAASEFADNLGVGNVGLSTGQGGQTSEPFLLDEASLGWTFARNRTTLSLFYTWSQREYESDPNQDQSLQSISARVSRDMSPRTSLEFFGSYGSADYQPPNPDYDEFYAGLNFSWRLSRNVVIDASYNYYNRFSDITQTTSTENRLLLMIGWGHGEPRRQRMAPQFGVDALLNSGN